MKTQESIYFKNNRQRSVFLALATTVSIVVAFLSIDRFGNDPKIVTGYVYEKQYESEIRPTMDREIQQPKDIKQQQPNYVLTINNLDGEHLSITVEPEYFYSAEVGQEVRYLAQQGLLTGWYWTKQIIY